MGDRGRARAPLRLGIALYQRAWHLGILAPAVEELRLWGAAAEAELDRGSLRRRMLIDFGLPLVFCCTLSLFSSLGLYRALVGSFGANAKEVLALVGSFVVLVATAGGVMVRAARDLSRPMTALAEAADKVGRGELEAAVPQVVGPDDHAPRRKCRANASHLGQDDRSPGSRA